MGFFERYFGISEDADEVAVRCPFPHRTESGLEYFETNPSAHVNTKQRLFHCKVCNQGHSETAFIAKVLECTYGNAARLAKVFNNSEDIREWDACTQLDASAKAMANRLGISDEVLQDLHVAGMENTLQFPVFINDKLIDIRTYKPGGTPKIKSRQGAISGAVIPYDKLADVPLNKTILICAGEKDMATTRSHGFHAFTITGGEMSLPFSPTCFRNRNVVILYDNDTAGKAGAVRLASYLLDYCATVKVCTKFHEVCVEDKEDMTDFWNKYKGTREQLIAMMNATPLFTKQEAVQDSTTPMVTLAQATSPNFIGKVVRSNIQVVAVNDTQFIVPTTITGEKLKVSDKGDDLMYAGEVRDWYLTEHNVQDILHLIDGGFKETDITKNIKSLLKIPQSEKYIRINKPTKEVVFKGYVTDMFESMNTDVMPMEYTAYCLGTRLESGKKYMCTYKLVPHPYKGQQLIMLIMCAVPANDSVSNFRVTSEAKQHLSVFTELQGTVKERVDQLVQKVKGLLGYNGNDTLIKLLDLSYHTVLSFNLGQFKNVRGYLDTLIVGESRVGKSSTAEALRNTYQLGTFTSLAGNSATVPGLIGGSNKTAGGSFQTKAGLIPQNHKGLIIFEEFGKCNSNLTAELTDIRSSNEVRITRISGVLSLPAMVRMIALSNVKSNGSEIKSIASYPNGISIVTELVPTAEDIARYDLLCVLGDKGNTQIDPYWEPEAPLPDEVYQTRVRWVWSRTPEQIIISEDVGRYILETANTLNKEYDCHIKIFGTEAWKKLSRLCIAIAGYVVSTDETFNNIVVTKEHVDYAADLFVDLYDNNTFRLKEYVENERKYCRIDDEGVNLLQQLYIKVPQLLIMLEQETRPTRTSLMAAVGLDQNTYNGFMSQLIRGSFVKLNNSDVLPTERFRLGMARINRNASLTRIGENNA